MTSALSTLIMKSVNTRGRYFKRVASAEHCRFSARHLRNKLVAEGFYLINVIEKYGSGFIRIRRALQEMTLPTAPRSRLQKYRLTEAGRQMQAVLRPGRSAQDAKKGPAP